MKIGLLFETKPDRVPEGCPPDIFMEFENIETIQRIAEELERLGHSVCLLDATRGAAAPLLEKSGQLDLVFNYSVGFGSRSRELLAPAICEALSIPYTGSDAMAQSIASNKHIAKLVAVHERVPTPEWHIVSDASRIPASLTNESAWIVKPLYEGSSIGISEASIVTDNDSLRKAISSLWTQYGEPALVEQFIAGMEITVPLLEIDAVQALPPVAMIYGGSLLRGRDIFSSHLKANPAEVTWTTEFPATAETVRQLQLWSECMFRACGCRDMARVDFRITEAGDPYFMEINPTPQLTPEGGTFAVSSSAIGLKFSDVLRTIVKSALRRGSNPYLFPKPQLAELVVKSKVRPRVLSP